jgi:hypothetical protein
MQNNLQTENSLRGWILFLPILFVAFFLRISHISDFSLMNDELSAWSRLQFPDFKSLIEGGCWVDGHPAGTQVFLYYWTSLFGDSPFALRIPFAIMSSFSILFAFLFTKRMFNINTALFVAASLTVLEYPLLYSCIARPYASGQLFVMMTAYFWSIIVFPKENKDNHWITTILLAISYALLLYTHYFSALTGIIIGISGFFFIKKSQAKYYLSAAIIASVLYTPHIPISFNHFSIGGVGEWLGAPELDWPFFHLLHLFNNSIILALIPLAIIWYLKPKKSSIPVPSLLMLIWSILPLAIGFFYSRYANPVLQHSVLIFSTPFILVFIFSFLPKQITKTSALLLSIMFIVFGIHTFIIGDFKNDQHFAEFEEIPKDINRINKEFGEDSITRVLHINNIDYLNYFQHKDSLINFELNQIRYPSDLDNLKTLLDTCTTPYFCLARIQYSNPIARNMILSVFPTIEKTIDYDDLSKVEVYSRKPNSKTVESIEITTGTSTNEYMGNISIKGNEIESRCNTTLAVEYLLGNESIDTNTIVAYQVVDENQQTKLWQGIPLKYFKQEGFYRVYYEFTPKEIAKDDEVKIYIWNAKQDSIIIQEAYYKLYHHEL